jgi:hypothetical protein
MLTLTLSAVLAASAPAQPTATNVATVVAADHGKIAWFEGTYDEAIKNAATSKKLVFMDFWTDW